MKALWAGLRWAVYKPWLNLAIGVSLVATAILEAVDTVFEQVIGVDVRAHYGILIFGLFQVGKSLADLFRGVEHIGKTRGGEDD